MHTSPPRKFSECAAARSEFVSGADHMGANEAVPTIWDPDYMV